MTFWKELSEILYFEQIAFLVSPIVFLRELKWVFGAQNKGVSLTNETQHVGIWSIECIIGIIPFLFFVVVVLF